MLCSGGAQVRMRYCMFLRIQSGAHNRRNLMAEPWVGTYSDIRDQRYRTELDIGTSDILLKRAESDIISDIGINFYPISDIRHPKIYKSAQWLRKQVTWVRILPC